MEMKVFLAVIAPAIVVGCLSAVSATDKPQAIAVDSIKDKVSIQVGEEFVVRFQRDGDQLRKPARHNVTDAIQGTVRVQLGTTSASPFPPPRKGATRPFLAVENNFEESLHFRTLVRLKGSKKLVELSESGKPIEAGEVFLKCWDFDTLVEEALLCEFRLSDEAVE
jgi:hypothetical protein